MGFDLFAAIAYITDDAAAEHVVATARTLARTEPALSNARARRFRDPFPGVIVGFDPHDQRDLLTDALGGDDNASDAAAEAVEAAFDPLMRALPEHAFAIVRAECFGGTCHYDGYVERGGERLGHVPTAADGHQQLFARLGVADAPWFFPGFTRGFFDTGAEPAGERARAVVCHATATWRDVNLVLATVAAAALAPVWTITVAAAGTLILVHADLWLSLHSATSGVELRASSHVDPDRTRAVLAQLCDALGGDGGEETIAITASNPGEATNGQG